MGTCTLLSKFSTSQLSAEYNFSSRGFTINQNFIGITIWLSAIFRLLEVQYLLKEKCEYHEAEMFCLIHHIIQT